MYPIDEMALRIATASNVAAALAEDIASGDINAQLIPQNQIAYAEVITRKPMVMCGAAWVDEAFKQVDPEVKLDWYVADGDQIEANRILFKAQGKARALLTAERTALNFVQLLSAVATKTRMFVTKANNAQVELIDTRKTIPGLRLAQKYAVVCGGGKNHRMGLYDAFLIKENHIAACGGIAQAIQAARALAPNKKVEVETENLEELDQALAAGADIIMLDNFSLEDTRIAVERSRGKAKIEASGGIDEKRLIEIVQTGVDYISMGTLTKDIEAADLSMRLFTE